MDDMDFIIHLLLPSVLMTICQGFPFFNLFSYCHLLESDPLTTSFWTEAEYSDRVF